MAIGVSSFRSPQASQTAVLDNPAEQLAELERQRAAIQKKIDDDRGRRSTVRRRELVKELAGLQLTDDGTGRRLEHAVMEAKKNLEAADLANRQYNANRNAKSIELQAKRGPLVAELLQTAPAAIDSEMQRLSTEIRQADSQRRTETGGGSFRKPVDRMSNVEAIDQFILAAEAAKRAINELRLQALDETELTAAIKRIVKGVPELDVSLRPVGPAKKNSQRPRRDPGESLLRTPKQKVNK